MQAIWNGNVVAESEKTVVVDGNHYFPRAALNMQYFEPSSKRTICPWKGEAHYYDVVVAGSSNEGAAWYYPKTGSRAEPIRDHIAFWRGVLVKE